MRNLNFIKCVRAVGRLIEINIGDINRIWILRIGDNVHVIPRTLPQGTVAVDRFPGLAAVIGAIDASLGSLDKGVNAIGVGGHGYTDASVRTFGQPVLLKLFPCGSAIVGAI